jgi:hypothetical protein
MRPARDTGGVREIERDLNIHHIGRLHQTSAHRYAFNIRSTALGLGMRVAS